MHILVHSGALHWNNVGDVAMLQAGVERLRELCPHASIAVITHAPETLALHCPGVEAVPLSGHVAFFSDRFFGRADQFLPRVLRERLAGVEEGLRRTWPAGVGSLIAAKRALAGREDYSAPLAYVRALRHADLVLVTGGGAFTDAFAENALAVLATLEFALHQKIPSALMGQGIGPVSSPVLRQRMAEVLPRVDLIAVRERLESVRLLQSLGVQADRLMVTGDDAIEMANRGARPELGNSIGVNIRIAGYAGTSGRALHEIRQAMQSSAARLAAPLVPVSIAQHPDCHDGVAIRDLLAGHDDAPVADAEVNTPANVINTVSRCRVVVTGSYHAAVFGIAQGIPVVAMAATPYYVNKFTGLAELFPGGCEIVGLDEPGVDSLLPSAIVRAWENAPGLREPLLHAARTQIEQGRAAYRRLGSLAATSRDGSGPH